MENYIRRLKYTKKSMLFFGTVLDNYLQFVRLLGRGKPRILDDSIHTLPYFAYISLRRNPKMKVIAHFKEGGPSIQKLIEELLMEVVVVK